MGCSKIKETCFDKHYATCVYYELDLPEISSITEGCVTLEDTTEDLYNIVTDLNTSLGLEEGEIVGELIDVQAERITELEAQVESLEKQSFCDLPIDSCNLDLQDLVDICGEQPTTVGELLQIIINQITA